ncbi:MAG TPA: CoA pyrophosphatase [Acidimicrobiales bacterium]|nr:CoA pyrophosphatase [Acidimicrobiales bacterium]
MSEAVDDSSRRGGPQVIPRPPRWRAGPGEFWSQPDGFRPSRITAEDIEAAIQSRGDPPPEPATEMPVVALPGPKRQPAAVLCVVFDEELGGEQQAHVVLTRRSSRMRSHTHQVSFPGGRLEPGEAAHLAALREAHEEVGIDPAGVRVIGRLTTMSTVMNPAPISPFVGVVDGRPELVPSPAEVERAFTVPVVELMEPDVYRQELWTFPDGREVPMSFFELIGDTVWGATARMLTELLDVVVGYLR